MKYEVKYTFSDKTNFDSVVTKKIFSGISCSNFPGWNKPDISASYICNDAANYIWVNPELVIFIRQKLRRKKIRKDFLFHYLYLCSTIVYLKHVDKRFETSEFVPINYKMMTSIISRDHYIEIIENLKDWGVIELNKSYQNGIRSKGFKLKSPYDINLKRRQIKDELINSKLNNYKRNSIKELEKLPFPYQYLAVANTRIRIDYQTATTYNAAIYFSTPNTTVYDSNFYSIAAYKDEDYRFSVDKFGNRAHTNLTNIKSDLRPYLKVDGEPLGQVDIRNSQPLFFYLQIKGIPGIPDFEKKKYKQLVESGRFYELFMEKLGIPPEKRSKIKPKILAALFFDRNRNAESRYVTIFRNEFPAIAAYIKRLRSHDHRALARILQKAESKFIIEKAVAEFINRFGDQYEFISTIHDSIVVKTEYLQMAEQIMRDCFQSEGIRAQLTCLEF